MPNYFVKTMTSDFWNDKYAAATYLYGKAPNRFLQLMLESRPPGRLLLPGEGEGRNAVYAAQMGWEVVAFDQAAVARRKALALAKSQNLEINYTLSDARDFEPAQKFDAVALIYAHFPPHFRAAFHRKAISWLKDTGEIWLEAFAPGQLEFSSGGPKEESLLYTPAMLSEDFAALQVRQCEILRYQLKEGLGHSGMGEVLRFRAQLPAPR